MIKFKFSTSKCLPKVIPNQYPELLKYEGEFIIEIDDIVYFQDANFAIFEFIYYVRLWAVDKKENMLINSMETEENPLISFIYTNGQWKICSPWQFFECERLFDSDELARSINALYKQLGY